MAKSKYLVLFFLLFFLSGCGEKKEKIPLKNDKKNLSNFLFVGKSGNNTALYNYLLSDSSYKKIWELNREKIVELNHSDDRESAFIITAKDFGKRGAFPFIKSIKLYYADPNLLNIEFVKELGDGLQLYTKWESDNNFKIVINSFNRTNANIVEQQTLIFTASGKIILDEIKIFDLTKEGYPNIPSKQKQLTFNTYELTSEENTIYLKNDGAKYPIFETPFEIRNAEWNVGGKYLIFTAVKITPDNETIYSNDPQTSVLIIYSIDQKKIVKRWDGGGIKSFFIRNNYLVFDDGFEENSSIKIVDIKTLSFFDTIKIKGGCGLRNIPQIPDYGA